MGPEHVTLHHITTVSHDHVQTITRTNACTTHASGRSSTGHQVILTLTINSSLVNGTIVNTQRCSNSSIRSRFKHLTQLLLLALVFNYKTLVGDVDASDNTQRGHEAVEPSIEQT
ncbi:hypothetical protein NP493_1399g00010 [Ridgeia piscesae]|uniref:Uncharacterized protein n=1 Tax=Ridgeia piscesae TaxID=27915 RepID=A0AAD9NDQ2_RIDPI|nr:hypothetical protein NP493_1399g00010 [Ridgeia piscesae]